MNNQFCLSYKLIFDLINNLLLALFRLYLSKIFQPLFLPWFLYRNEDFRPFQLSEMKTQDDQKLNSGALNITTYYSLKILLVLSKNRYGNKEYQ